MKVPEISSTELVIKNLSSEFGESELEELFSGVGSVAKSEISEGGATVEMASVEDAQKAVRFLDGKDFMGKTLSLSEAAQSAEKNE